MNENKARVALNAALALVPADSSAATIIREALEGYNGWKNYETWSVNLWINNTEGLADHWQSAASALVEDISGEGRGIPSQVEAGTWTPKEAARFLLSDNLKEQMTEDAPELAGMYGDLLSSALQDVEWDDIADAILEAVPEYEKLPR